MHRLGFEAPLFLAADKQRKNLKPSDYKHVWKPKVRVIAQELVAVIKGNVSVDWMHR